jgi:rhodanese-related sulfurtransferase
MSLTSIPANQLPQLLAQGAKVIDVRTPGEYKSVHVEGAELLPLDTLQADAFCDACGSETPVYILCQSGKRASLAAEKLISAGHCAVVVVEGGTAAAINDGVTVVRDQGVISIERQVRIAAGSLVVIGVIAALLISSGFLILSGFVGAGLIFAGVTDTCGMGLMLAKCPWNR